MAIDNRLKTWADFRKGKQDSELDFRMEDLNEMIGENENAFFSLKSFKDNQILDKAFYMPTSVDLIVNGIEPYKKPKDLNEVRLVVSDFAWTMSNYNGNESDNSIAICMSGVWKKNHFEIRVDYISIISTADNADECAHELKRLYWLYDADYLVPDARSGGEAVMTSLSKNDIDEEYGSFIPAKGLGICDNNIYHVAAPEKLKYYREHTIDNNFVPCVIPVLGNLSINTQYWRATKLALERGFIKFLVSMGAKQEQLEDSGEYFKLTSEQLANVLNPYGQTDMLITEAINLESKIKADQIILEAPAKGHRDRIVTLGMGILIFSLIENEWLKQNQNEDFSLADFECVW